MYIYISFVLCIEMKKVSYCTLNVNKCTTLFICWDIAVKLTSANLYAKSSDTPFLGACRNSDSFPRVSKKYKNIYNLLVLSSFALNFPSLGPGAAQRQQGRAGGASERRSRPTSSSQEWMGGSSAEREAKAEDSPTSFGEKKVKIIRLGGRGVYNGSPMLINIKKKIS